MENIFFNVSSRNSPKITIQVAEGHFVTGNTHISHYIDISELKSGSSIAKEVARELAIPYLANTMVDVIIYMDGTEVLAAYLADELLQAGVNVMNEGREIYIITPMRSADGKFIFHENVQKKILNKNVVLMVASLSTGATANAVLECLNYYGCELVGISAVFSAVPAVSGRKVHALFTNEDVPNYRFFYPSQCLLCQEGKKIDAITNSEGYTAL